MNVNVSPKLASLGVSGKGRKDKPEEVWFSQLHHLLPTLHHVHCCLFCRAVGVNSKSPRAGREGRVDSSQEGSAWGFCTAFLSNKIDFFLLDSPSVNESTVLPPGIINFWGDNQKGIKTTFEKCSKVDECHISPSSTLSLPLHPPPMPVGFDFCWATGRGKHKVIVCALVGSLG